MTDLIEQLILSTDMALHWDLLSSLQAKTGAGGVLDLGNSEEDRVLLMQLVLKAADLSNVARPWWAAAPSTRRGFPPLAFSYFGS